MLSRHFCGLDRAVPTGMKTARNMPCRPSVRPQKKRRHSRESGNPSFVGLTFEAQTKAVPADGRKMDSRFRGNDIYSSAC
jgi:hypothetical protein